MCVILLNCTVRIGLKRTSFLYPFIHVAFWCITVKILSLKMSTFVIQLRWNIMKISSKQVQTVIENNFLKIYWLPYLYYSCLPFRQVASETQQRNILNKKVYTQSKDDVFILYPSEGLLAFGVRHVSQRKFVIMKTSQQRTEFTIAASQPRETAVTEPYFPTNTDFYCRSPASLPLWIHSTLFMH